MPFELTCGPMDPRETLRKAMMKHRAAVFVCFIALLAAGWLLSDTNGVPSHGSGTSLLYAAGPVTPGAADTRSGAAPAAEPSQPQASAPAMIWTILGIFLGGIALNLTPCVYPLIPVTISYFGGRATGRTSDVAVHALIYVIGLALVNSMLGVFAALSGRLIGTVLQDPLTLVVVAAILAAFALSMFGLWEFRLPHSVTAIAAKTYAGYFGSFFIGLTMGFVAAPCVGPFVVGLLVWVAKSANPWFGFAVFFSLSLGMGLPLFVLALLSGRLQSLPRSGEWMLWVRKLMGWVLLGMAAYYLKGILLETWGTVLVAATALAAGIHLGWVDSTKAGFPSFGVIKKLAGLTAVGIAIFVAWPLTQHGPAIKWLPYSQKVLAEAKQSGKPILVDFSAEWCVPCRHMERLTFHDPAVVEYASKYFITIRVDVTRGGDPQKEEIAHRYNIVGVPTVLFLKPGGEERRDLRVMEFTEKDRFLARMVELRSSSK